MNVAAIQSIVLRQRAVEQAQMLAALRRSSSATGTTRAASFVSELNRPFDASTANIPPINISSPADDFKTGLLA